MRNFKKNQCREHIRTNISTATAAQLGLKFSMISIFICSTSFLCSNGMQRPTTVITKACNPTTYRMLIWMTGTFLILIKQNILFCFTARYMADTVVAMVETE
jgi:hypothetical protein